MKRLFTAIEIPQAVASNLALLRGGIPGARWIDPENYHITLRFIGEVDGVLDTQIRHELQKIHSGPLSLFLRGVRTFGNKKPRSIYAAVGLNDALLRVQKQQERLLQIIGLKPEHRKFSPHVTLARLRNTTATDVERFCVQNALSINEEFIASGFVLYSSKPSTGGGPYVVEERYQFSGSSGG